MISTVTVQIMTGVCQKAIFTVQWFHGHCFGRRKLKFEIPEFFPMKFEIKFESPRFGYFLGLYVNFVKFYVSFKM